jgi:hypothetical protein
MASTGARDAAVCAEAGALATGMSSSRTQHSKTTRSISNNLNGA